MKSLTRNLIVSIFCASAFLFSRCDDDNAPVFIPDEGSESFFKDGVILSPVAGKQTISFTTSEDWMMSMAEPSALSTDWCTVSPMSGTAGDASITISASENTGYDDRSTVIILTAGELQKTIAVTQKQTGALIISRKSYVLSSEARTIQVDLSSNIDYQVIIPEAGNWITQVTATKALTDSKLQFNVQANKALNTRSGMIIIKDSKTTLADTVTVMQTGKSTVVEEGFAGDQKWTLFENGTLILAGNGRMPDFNHRTPWYDYNSSITTVIIEDGVTSIGSSAFERCSNLTHVMIPDGIMNINAYAFFRCSSLASVAIPNGVKWIYECAFAFCSSLTAIMIPNSVEIIWSGAFGECISLNEIVVAPDNPNYVSVNGVLFDKNQTTLVSYPGGKTGSYIIPGSVTSIGTDAFWGCSGLTAITIPNSVTSIRGGAFDDCNGLTAITIPNSVTSIGGGAFGHCSGLTAIIIPNSVTSIGSGVVAWCGGLNEIVVAPDNPNYKSVNGVLFDKNQTTLIAYPDGKTGSYAIPGSVTTIAGNAFSGVNLTSLLIPNSVTAIDHYAFLDCNITSVTINMAVIPGFDSLIGSLRSLTFGSSVTSIRATFSSCDSLAEVHVKATTPPSLENPYGFLGTPDNKILYVPEGCKPAYQSSDWGKYFDTIIEE